MEQQTLLTMLQNPDYLKQYVKYKVWTEHMPIPIKLLKDAPLPTKIALLETWNKEWIKYKRKLTHGRSRTGR